MKLFLLYLTIFKIALVSSQYNDIDDDDYTPLNYGDLRFHINFYNNMQQCNLKMNYENIIVDFPFPEDCSCKYSYENCFNKLLNSYDFTHYNWSHLLKENNFTYPNTNISACILNKNNTDYECLGCENYTISINTYSENDTCLRSIILIIIVGLLFSVLFGLVCFCFCKTNIKNGYTPINDRIKKKKYIFFT